MSTVVEPTTPDRDALANRTERLAAPPRHHADGERLFEVVQRRCDVEKNMGVSQNLIDGDSVSTTGRVLRRTSLAGRYSKRMFAIPGSGNDRKPDVAFVSFDRWATDRRSQCERLAGRAGPGGGGHQPHGQCIRHGREGPRVFRWPGCEQVWQVFSNTEQVLIFTAPDAVRVLTRTDDSHGRTRDTGVSDGCCRSVSSARADPVSQHREVRRWTGNRSGRSSRTPIAPTRSTTSSRSRSGSKGSSGSRWSSSRLGSTRRSPPRTRYRSVGRPHLINGGCSDDGFRDFRVWLVGRGRHAYEAALKNPDTLADILDGDPVDGFGLDAAALRVYEAKTGMSDFFDRLDREEKDAPPPPPEGDDWDFDDAEECASSYPRLCHLYLVPQRTDEVGMTAHRVQGPLLRPRGRLPRVPAGVPARTLRVPRVGSAGPRPRLGLRHRQRAGRGRLWRSTSRRCSPPTPAPSRSKNAEPHPQVEYAVAPAEQCPLADHSADLVTVTQALHWFDLDRFYAEVRRVVRPGGLLAATCYYEPSASPEVDPVLRKWDDFIRPYWTPERVWVDEGYRTIPVPISRIARATIRVVGAIVAGAVLGYIGTWSATKEYREGARSDPLERFAPEFAAAWGDPATVRTVRWQFNRAAWAGATMNFLALETSCDETAAAVFTDELAVLSSVVASQTDLHARFGGVVPGDRVAAHLRNLLPVIDEALAPGRRRARRTSAASPSTTRRGWSGRCWSACQRREDARARPRRAAGRGEPRPRATSTPAGWPRAATSSRASGWSSAAGTRPCSAATPPLSTRPARRHPRRRGRRGVRQGRGDPRPRLPRRPGGRARGRGRRPEGVRLPALVPRRRPARVQLQRAEDGGALRLPRAGREQGRRRPPPGKKRADLAASFQAAVVDVLVGKCKQALRKTGLKRLAVGGGVSANKPLRAALGGDVCEGGGGAVHPAARAVHRQRRDGGAGGREVEAQASSPRPTWTPSRLTISRLCGGRAGVRAERLGFTLTDRLPNEGAVGTCRLLLGSSSASSSGFSAFFFLLGLGATRPSPSAPASAACSTSALNLRRSSLGR